MFPADRSARSFPFGSLVLCALLALLSCTTDETPNAPVPFTEGRVYEGLGVYKNVLLAGGNRYFAYGDTLPITLGGIDVPSRCLLEDFRMGGRDVVADFGSDTASGDGGSVGFRESDSAFFFMFEFVLGGALDQSCALLEAPFDTSFSLLLTAQWPVRKLVVLGWNDLTSVTSGGVTTWYPRSASPKDSVWLRYGRSAPDTLKFSVDSLRNLKGPSDAKLVRVPGSTTSYSGILRFREQLCSGTASSCASEKDTVYRKISGARDTIYKLVRGGDYVLVEDPGDDERIWGRAWRVLRGKDTALVLERSAADSVVLASLYYVLRGGDTLLSADTVSGTFPIDTVVRTVEPDTVEIVERTSCLGGRNWCSSDSLYERTKSVSSDTGTVVAVSWRSALVEKVPACARLNRFAVASFSEPGNSEKRFVRSTFPKFLREIFTLDSSKEDCAAGQEEHWGWILPAGTRVLGEDTLRAWWEGREP